MSITRWIFTIALSIILVSHLLNNGNWWGCVYLLVSEAFLGLIFYILALQYVREPRKWYFDIIICGVLAFQLVNILHAVVDTALNFTYYDACTSVLQDAKLRWHEKHIVPFRLVSCGVWIAVVIGGLTKMNSNKLKS